MIKVSVDESYAYDMLSILKVKAIETANDEAIHKRALDNYLSFGKELSLQLPEHDLVTESVEYLELFETNLQLFKKIDQIKTSGANVNDARTIDELNYQRYLLKKKIQEKYFPNSAFKEQKIGYKNE